MTGWKSNFCCHLAVEFWLAVCCVSNGCGHPAPVCLFPGCILTSPCQDEQSGAGGGVLMHTLVKKIICTWTSRTRSVVAQVHWAMCGFSCWRCTAVVTVVRKGFPLFKTVATVHTSCVMQCFSTAAAQRCLLSWGLVGYPLLLLWKLFNKTQLIRVYISCSRLPWDAYD